MLRRPSPSSGPLSLGRPAPLQIGSQIDRHARPELPPIEPARNGQDRVANRLALEPPQPHAMHEGVGRILLVGGRGSARHLIRPREDQRANQPLGAPALGGELMSQIIEQFGMARRLAQHAEIIDTRHDAGAEQMVPDSVNHHPGNQRIVGGDQPAGQLQPSTARAGLKLAARGKGFERPARDRIAGRAWIAPNQERLVEAVAFQQGRRQVRGFGNLPGQFGLGSAEVGGSPIQFFASFVRRALAAIPRSKTIQLSQQPIDQRRRGRGREFARRLARGQCGDSRSAASKNAGMPNKGCSGTSTTRAIANGSSPTGENSTCIRWPA